MSGSRSGNARWGQDSQCHNYFDSIKYWKVGAAGAGPVVGCADWRLLRAHCTLSSMMMSAAQQPRRTTPRLYVHHRRCLSLLYSAHSWFYELDFYSTETRINVTSATAAAPYGALRGWLTVVVVCVGCVMSLMTVDDACGSQRDRIRGPLFCFETTKF